MSGYGAKMWFRLSRCVLVVILSAFISSCNPWQVRCYYNGPKRPIQEVAVVCQSRGVNVTQIDQDDSDDYPFEIHLPPGMHSITTEYSTWWKSFLSNSGLETTWRVHSVYGEPVTITQNFERGHVYLLDPEFSEGKWWLSVKDFGKHYDLVVVSELCEECPWATDVFSETKPPPHWREFVGNNSCETIEKLSRHQSESWNIYQAYDGPELNLDEVVVLLGVFPKICPGARISFIDGMYIGKYESYFFYEFHLIPGLHSITASFEYDIYNNLLHDFGPITIEHRFVKGHVYTLMPWYYYDKIFHEERQENIKVVDLGTVEEVAPDVISGWGHKVPPAHWREFAQAKNISKRENENKIPIKDVNNSN